MTKVRKPHRDMVFKCIDDAVDAICLQAKPLPSAKTIRDAVIFLASTARDWAELAGDPLPAVEFSPAVKAELQRLESIDALHGCRFNPYYASFAYCLLAFRKCAYGESNKNVVQFFAAQKREKTLREQKNLHRLIAVLCQERFISEEKTSGTVNGSKYTNTYTVFKDGGIRESYSKIAKKLMKDIKEVVAET